MADRTSSNNIQTKKYRLRPQDQPRQSAETSMGVQERKEKETLQTENAPGAKAEPASDTPPVLRAVAPSPQAVAKPIAQGSDQADGANNQMIDETDSETGKSPLEDESSSEVELVAKPAKPENRIKIELSPTNEEAVIFQAVNCPPSQEIELKIHQEMSRDFLLRLERAVSDEGKGPRVLHLECSAWDEPVEPTFEFPTGPSLQISSIDFGAYVDFTKLKDFLKRENPQLKSLSWHVMDPSAEEAEALVEALCEGSHQLREIELREVPANAPAFATMLKKKSQLETLKLGDVVLNDACLLKDLLTPTLTHLHLSKVTFASPGCFKGCLAAFSKTRLTEIAFLSTKVGKTFNALDPDFAELQNGLRRTPKLSSLVFKDFGKSEADLPILMAFGENPEAGEISITGTYFKSALLDAFAKLNLERSKSGHPLLKLNTGGATALLPIKRDLASDIDTSGDSD